MSQRREAAWLPALTLAAVWLALWNNLAAHWSANPQYGYGWLVPLLQIALVHRRWSTRPGPQSSASWGKWLALTAAGALLPTWIVAQPSPDWVLVNWLLAGEVVALTLGVVALLGGGAWMRHFAFPIVFILAAVPWPSVIEQPVVQGLMRIVAGITVVFLNFLGTPALQHGSLIEIGAGVLGVDEACSGVRSLQATLMAALFFGELHRFRPGQRATLVCIGTAAAFLTNIVRTIFLCLAAARGGLTAISRWHDPAGYTILTACLVAVWLVALILLRGHREPPPAHANSAPHALPRWFGATLAAWLLLIFCTTEWWYGRATVTARAAWTLVPPTDARALPIEPRTTEMLRYDRAVSATWSEPDRTQWSLFFFEWEPGPSRARILARMHRPEVCLPASGFRQADPPRLVEVEAAGLTLPFQATRFLTGRDAAIYAYYCSWETHGANAASRVPFAQFDRFESLRQVWRRERNLGQQVAELIVAGPATAEEADAAFKRNIGRLLQPAAPR